MVTYSEEIAAKICERLKSGESLRSICRDEDMPDESTVRQWSRDNEAFAPQYAHARLVGYAVMADDLTLIADDGVNDYVEQETANGGTRIVADQEHIARSRLRVDTRKWILSKMLPKVYGDKLALEHSGEINISERLVSARKRTNK